MGTKCDTGGGVEGGDTKPKKKNQQIITTKMESETAVKCQFR